MGTLEGDGMGTGRVISGVTLAGRAVEPIEERLPSCFHDGVGDVEDTLG